MCDPGPQHRVGEKPDAIELDDGRRMPHVGDAAIRHRRSHHHTELSAAERAIALSAADNSAPALPATGRGARCRRVCSGSSVSGASRPPLLGTLREHGFIAANYDRACDLRVRLVPPAGFEPAPPPPEGGALSPELRGRRPPSRLAAAHLDHPGSITLGSLLACLAVDECSSSTTTTSSVS